ncbi:MAG: hypothetical protein H0X46_06435, partial [Bacteroidetes bacterium]|nr:hypothetical protein [Bacteroidota bacterium]
MFFNHVAAVALLISYLAPHVSPQSFWFIAFFGLAYPVLVIINFLFVIYWFIQIKKRGFYSLIIILAGFTNLYSYFQFSPGSIPDGSKKLLSVMSYNVKVFDLYDWTKNNQTRNKMFALISNESPEILCMQEFYHRDSSKYANTDSLMRFPHFKYYHTEYTANVKPRQHFGIATFSTHPIINRGKVDFGYKGNNICIYTDIVVAKDTFRVFNMHLQSIAFSWDDYKFIDDLQKNVETENIEKSKNILKRLKRAFIKRANQADMVKA